MFLQDDSPRCLPFENIGDVCRKIWIEPLKETNLGVAGALLTPQKVPAGNRN